LRPIIANNVLFPDAASCHYGDTLALPQVIMPLMARNTDLADRGFFSFRGLDTAV
jgi:hypothetical protein